MMVLIDLRLRLAYGEWAPRKMDIPLSLLNVLDSPLLPLATIAGLLLSLLASPSRPPSR